jgi:suppressor of ftsI
MLAAPGESLHCTIMVPADAPPGLYRYHTHPRGESYRQVLDGLSDAIVIEGIDHYAPEVRTMRERLLVLRSMELKEHDPHRAKVLQQAPVVDSRGTSKEKPERVLTVNNQLRPQIPIAPGERQFWRIVNASPDLYADLQIDAGQLEIVALDGMPLRYHDPKRHNRRVDHILLSPAGRVEAIVMGPVAGRHASLRSRCIDTGKDGDPNPEMVLADLTHQPEEETPRAPTVTQAAIYKRISQKRLAQIEKVPPQYTVVFTEDKTAFYINGRTFSMTSDPVLTVRTGSYQHWRVIDETDELHPFHIH